MLVASKEAEKTLVKGLKTGCSRDVQLWYSLYYPLLLGVAKTKVGCFKDAQDIVQETMINALRQIQLFREESSLKTWMLSILRHEVADYYRKKYAKKALKLVPLGEHLLSRSISDSFEVQLAVKKVLSQMAGQRKRLLLMKYVDGLKVKEIARKLGKTYKSVETELYRARESFKKRYAQQMEVLGQ